MAPSDGSPVQDAPGGTHLVDAANPKVDASAHDASIGIDAARPIDAAPAVDAPPPDAAPACPSALFAATMNVNDNTGPITSGGQTISITLVDVDVSLPQVLLQIQENGGTPYQSVIAQGASETSGNGFVTRVLLVDIAARRAFVCVTHP